MSDIDTQSLETLLNKQRNVKITLGVAIGLVLIVYFFTFATLLDKVSAGFFAFEIISGFLMVFVLFRLNKISFAWIRLRFGNKPAYQAFFSKLQAGDVDRPLEQITRDW